MIRFCRYFLQILLLFIAYASFAQSVLLPQEIERNISVNRIMRNVKVLSSDSLMGRSLENAGHAKSASYIAQELKQSGISPVSTSYLLPVPLARCYWNEVYVKRDNYVLSNFNGIIYNGNPIDEPISKQLVFRGYVSADSLELTGMSGCIVVLFIDNLWKDINLLKRIKRSDAYGYIFVNPSNQKQYYSLERQLKEHYTRKRVLPRFKVDDDAFSMVAQLVGTADIYLDAPRFMMPLDKLATLLDVSERKLLRASESGDFADIPMPTVTLRSQRVVEPLETSNVVGVIPGAVRGQRAIVVSAHYDHLGNDGALYAGADDNASGVAVVLELARLFRVMGYKPQNDIVFAFFGAEELGMLGSMAFVATRKQLADSIVANINIDMIGRVDSLHSKRNGYMYLLGAGKFAALGKAFAAADSLTPEISIDYSLDNANDIFGMYNLSDQRSFVAKQIPAVLVTSGLHGDYHTPRDVYNKLDYNQLKLRTSLLLHAIVNIDKQLIIGSN
ncbi:MAG: M20/M25/M40 family metallo-hydrolase [Bacteroidales bacterium]|nr:M20/M25/M40 family metallo-hydrolase [Bacteroidales bacterium]MBN2749609.1 M20/M25/M40 family metallo-hydrolase [Bacteroidales bacterium]